VNNYRFLNTMQPQTLVNATIICYIEAFFGLISGAPILIVVGLGLGAGGFGIANDKRWGYTVAVGAAVLQVVVWLAFFGLNVLGFPQIISFAFAVLLAALLLHPLSRDHQRIWFQ
jgi:hypothetical protein